MARRPATYEELAEMYQEVCGERDELQEKIDSIVDLVVIEDFEDEGDSDNTIYVETDEE